MPLSGTNAAYDSTALSFLTDLHWLCLNLHLAAVGEIDYRPQYDLIARLDAGANLDLRPEIACHRDLVQMRHTTRGNSHLQAIAVEDHGIGGDDQRRRFSRNMQVHRAIHARAQQPIGIGNVDLGQKRGGAGRQRSARRVTVPENLRSGISGTRTSAATPLLTPNAASCGT